MSEMDTFEEVYKKKSNPNGRYMHQADTHISPLRSR